MFGDEGNWGAVFEQNSETFEIYCNDPNRHLIVITKVFQRPPFARVLFSSQAKLHSNDNSRCNPSEKTQPLTFDHPSRMEPKTMGGITDLDLPVNPSLKK